MSDCPECPGTDHPSHRQRHEMLPATLSTPDDVARVCEAAGLGERAAPGGQRIWDGAYCQIRTSFIGRFLLVAVSDNDGNSWTGSGPRMPFAPMWAAIEAARAAGDDQ